MSRVLLIEDEVGIRMTVQDRLEAEGYDIETAADGQEGYERALLGGIDLIVLDLMLPGKPGLDVCRDLRADGIPTPVLMLTAKGQLEDRVAGLRTGADDYLVKPFEMLELVARIEAMFAARQDEGRFRDRRHLQVRECAARRQTGRRVPGGQAVAAFREGVPAAPVFCPASP